MKPDELDKATADEAWRLLEEGQDVAVIAARLAREGWKPPEPVMDPELDRVTEDEARRLQEQAQELRAFAARLAREQEQERARVLVEPAEAIVNRAVKGTGSNGARWVHIVKAARRLEKGLTAYKAERTAR
jgi:hypothetical protein